MTKQFDKTSLMALMVGERVDVLQQLVRLLDKINWDEDQERLTIRNGDAALHLTADGTIRLEGKRIVQCADHDISMSGAWIDLN